MGRCLNSWIYSPSRYFGSALLHKEWWEKKTDCYANGLMFSYTVHVYLLKHTRAQIVVTVGALYARTYSSTHTQSHKWWIRLSTNWFGMALQRAWYATCNCCHSNLSYFPSEWVEGNRGRWLNDVKHFDKLILAADVPWYRSIRIHSSNVQGKTRRRKPQTFP